MKRLGRNNGQKGIRDFVFDTLIHGCVPDWEVTEYTVFPEIKKWISSQSESENITEAKAALKNISCISENILITDALITSTLKNIKQYGNNKNNRKIQGVHQTFSYTPQVHGQTNGQAWHSG